MRTVSQISSISAILLVCGIASAQTALYSNGSSSPLDPGLATGSVSAGGTPAPAGSVWSELPSIGTRNTNAMAGFSAHGIPGSDSYRFADDFTVAGGSWRLTGASFFAYQTGDAGIPGSSPFAAINLRIWSGPPGDAGSTVIYGDATTNVLVASTPTSIYRIFNSNAAPLPQTPDTSRVIWQSNVAVNSLILPPGTYWLDWQYASVDPDKAVFVPPVTLVGSRGKPGANGLQLKFGVGAWVPLMDTGKPSSAGDVAQDLPFLLSGAPFCPADFNLDGVANADDLGDYITGYFDSPADPRTDYNGDGIINADDLSDFITAYFTGC